MKGVLFTALLTAFWVGAFTIPASTQMFSTNFSMPTEAFSAFGGADSSTNFSEPVSIGGQSTPIGDPPSTSTGYRNFAGYLYTLQAVGRTCAIPGDVSLDGVADIVDIVAMINNTVFGTPLPGGEVCGDIVIDGVIDISDIICLINNVVFGNPVPC